MNATYTIPESNLPEFERAISKLNKRAVRLGVAPVLFTTEFSHTEEYFATQADREFDVKSLRQWYKVEVTGEAPKIAGWTFAATLNHTSEGNILGVVPGHEGNLPLAFRSAEPSCAHCMTQRRRNDTFVVVSEAGEYKQVGRQCLKDFLGHTDPHGIARYAEMLAAFDAQVRDMEDGEYGGGRVEPEWALEGFLAATSLLIGKLGWTSRTTSREYAGLTATADYVMMYVNPCCPADEKFRAEVGKVGEEQQTEAQAAIAWVESELASREATLSDYEYNLLVVVRAGKVTGRTIGLSASIIPAYRRAVQKELERKLAGEKKGPVPTGDRIVVEGVITKLDSKDNGYTVREVMTVTGEEGWMVWGTVPRTLLSAKVGDRVRFSAKVEASEDKPFFGFFSRPTKAEVVEGASAPSA